VGIFDFLKYRNGKAIIVNFLDTRERLVYVIGETITKDQLKGRIDRKTGELYAVNYYDERGNPWTQLVSPEDRDFWSSSVNDSAKPREV
jgi:hypothetical protein